MNKLQQQLGWFRHRINETFNVQMTHEEVAELRKIAKDFESYRRRQQKKIAHIVAGHHLSYRHAKVSPLLICLPGETYEENPKGVEIPL